MWLFTPQLMLIGASISLLGVVFGDNPRCWNAEVNFKTCCDLSLGPTGNDACWEVGYTFENCCGTVDPAVGNEALGRLAAQDAGQGFPACIESDIILRHDGQYGVFADLSFYAHKGCFEGNCSHTDKFTVEVEDPGICGRACADVDECTHWAYGLQGGVYKCFLRNSAAGGAFGVGWKAGAKACTPPPIGPGFMALTFIRSEGLKACDSLEKAKCPDIHMAITTWAFLLKHLVRASQGRLDEASMQYVQNIHDGTMKCLKGVFLEYVPHVSDYRTCEVGEVVYNNRQIVNQLTGWLEAHPKIEVSATDISLPNPMRTGQLCGRTSCYENVEKHLALLTAEHEQATRKEKPATGMPSGLAEGVVTDAGDVALDAVGAEAAAAAKEAAAAVAALAPQEAATAAAAAAEPDSADSAPATETPASEVEVENEPPAAAKEAAMAAAAAGAADAAAAAAAKDAKADGAAEEEARRKAEEEEAKRKEAEAEAARKAEAEEEAKRKEAEAEAARRAEEEAQRKAEEEAKRAAAAAVVTEDAKATCEDGNDSCASWAASGECENNPKYMKKACKKSCGTCSSAS